MMLTCTDAPPGGSAKKVKEFLKKSLGMSMQVKLMDPNGAVVEDNGEPEDVDQVQASDAGRDPD